jgi:hypothetical protein
MTMGSSDSQVRPNRILIDNDELIRDLWEMEASRFHEVCMTFKSVDEFQSHNFDKDVPIYIDYKLSDHQTGVEVAKSLFEQGYTNIQISTGYDPKSISLPPFLNHTVGKSYPRQAVSGEYPEPSPLTTETIKTLIHDLQSCFTVFEITLNTLISNPDRVSNAFLKNVLEEISEKKSGLLSVLNTLETTTKDSR